jgi:arylsulfatase A-like enzyme
MSQISRRHLLAAGVTAAGAGPLAGQIRVNSERKAEPVVEIEQPAVQKGNGLNLITICVDTWGANYFGCYGNDWIKSPNMDRLAAKSALFLDAYSECLPTIPMRRVLYTGRRIFPTRQIVQPGDQVKIRGWHQLFAEDITISEMLKAASYRTALVSDLYHTFKPGKNFHRGFDCWRWTRGQEQDHWESGPTSKIDLAGHMHASQKTPPGSIDQFLLNRQDWRNEEDWLAPRVFTDAIRWLDRNAAEAHPFYLHVGSFSPHELWDPYEDYYRLYMKKDYKGPRLIWPPSVTKVMTPLEVEHARSLYFGLVTMVDTWAGKLFDKIESMGLMQNTVIMVTADHGTMMGEQGQIHKGEDRIRKQVTRVPFIIYDPRKKYNGRKVAGFVQHPDIVPSLLELLDLKPPKRVTGESVIPLLAGNRTGGLRDTVITGWGIHATVRTHEWALITRWLPANSPHNDDQLYNVEKDPEELTNVADKFPAVTAELRRKLNAYIDSGRGITDGTFSTDMA